MVEGNSLENCRTFTCTVSSNLTSSAMGQNFMGESHFLTGTVHLLDFSEEISKGLALHQNGFPQPELTSALGQTNNRPNSFLV